MLKRIHHLDFVVRDLDSAVERYRRLFGVEARPRERLAHRGVELVRFRVGETWVILVQPVSDESPVMDWLRRRGEGFFHLAYEVDSIDTVARELREKGVRLAGSLRQGVDGWKLLDLEIDETLGVMTQLVEPDREDHARDA